MQGDRFCMARDVHQDEIYTKKSRVGITLGIYKLSGLGTLIKKADEFLLFIRFFVNDDIGKRTWSSPLRNDYSYQLQQETDKDRHI